ncbi:MAG: oligosaccharide flippase family protein [bacterium]|nr:oligosaccharide flippase family protein [bacterium]
MSFLELTEKPISALERFLGTDTKYLMRGGFWLTLGSIAGMTIAFALSVAYARYITKDIYGSYRYLFSIIGMAGIFSLPGMGTAIVRSVARGYDRTYIKNAFAIFISSIGISLVAIVAAFVFFLQNQPPLAYGFLVIALFIPFVEGMGSWKAYLDGKKEFKKKTFYTTIVNVISGVTMLGTILAIYFWKLDATYAVPLLAGTYFATRGIPNILIFYKTVKSIPKDARIEPGGLRYGVHLSLASIPATIANYIDGVILFHYFGAAQLAIYSFAVVMPEQVKKLLTNVATATFPKLSEKISDEEVKKSLPHKIFRASILTTLIIGAYILLAPYFYQIFFPRYIESIEFSQVFALSLVLFPFGIFGNALKAEGNIRKIYIHSIGVPVLQIVALLILIPIFGLWGAVLGRVVGRLLNHLLSLILFQM